ncbi:MAG: CRISPR system precrRNA processing endoribonuclease RAMP protein Cas6 [Bryobacteraceae bacterium]|nr:CRISPR system precrRNA processing endoribonuclease RAMP protein Cas6 [Bryobacteraceae bacterium]
MTFSVWRRRFRYRAAGPITFPAWKAGNVLRGALGTVLSGEVFRPSLAEGPSGLADPPRPFVLRASHLNGQEVQGEFWYDVHLFRPDIEGAFGLLRRIGGTAVVLDRCDDLGFASVKLDEPCAGRASASLAFEMPVRLKGLDDGERPSFEVLFARLRDRISTLRALYGEGPLEIDFRGMAERAGRVELESAAMRFVEVERRSSRTGQTHPLGGWVGELRYRGDLAEFWPYLVAGEYTGVGRQTVWGNGAYRLGS